MSERPKTGRRVQVYLPADLLEWWDTIPRYERSGTVAAALRAWRSGKHTANHTAASDRGDTGGDTASAEGVGKR